MQKLICFARLWQSAGAIIVYDRRYKLKSITQIYGLYYCKIHFFCTVKNKITIFTYLLSPNPNLAKYIESFYFIFCEKLPSIPPVTVIFFITLDYNFIFSLHDSLLYQFRLMKQFMNDNA